ncbi:hypothetical protein [Prosthecomicrobium pneumaticum]|uniref:Uncharacterized protein n=1 Tax=Prosthecomicrobium pneumaticum TaxID=81895 RepID=A0A7W9FRA1_9HYPH|nr:hypothetical protein [Prosthecomicrobium pneumaticum]MBB5755306.1 hypothetical protein [Prosthecomicrobium pneumaticum]
MKRRFQRGAGGIEAEWAPTYPRTPGAALDAILRDALWRAIGPMIEILGRYPTEAELDMVARAVLRHLDEPNAPSTRLQ